MAKVLVIGGSGFASKLQGHGETVHTRFGPVPVLTSRIGDHDVYAIRRHGAEHTVPPHNVNHKAHIDAARELEATAIFASSAVGIIDGYAPGQLILCSDALTYHLLLDGKAITYTHSFPDGRPQHRDSSALFSPLLNTLMQDAAADVGVQLRSGAVLALTYGPRFETPADIRALKILGANLAGMTAVYEAILANELGIPYAVLAIGTNWAAGIQPDAKLSHGEVEETMARKGEEVFRLLRKAIECLPGDSHS